MRFFSLLKKSIKDTKETYRKLKAEEKLKKQELNIDTDWYIIEGFIKKINEDPNLRVKVTLKDGTVLELNTYREKQRTEYTRLEY